MNPVELSIRLVAGVLLILSNGFFVAIEFALTRARQYDRAEFVGDGHPALERAWAMTNDLEVYLTTCQVGITASSIAVGIVAEPALAAIFEPLFAGTRLAAVGTGAIIAFLIINLVHLTHGEQTPTYLGVERSRTVCRYGARPLHWFYVLISPVIRLGDSIAKGTLGLMGIQMTGAWLETETDVIESRAELRNRLGSVLDAGDLSEERREEVMNALDVGEQPIADIMVPADEIIALSTSADPETTLERMSEHPHTRYPVIGDDLSDFIGILYVPVLMRHREALTEGEVDLAALAAPPVSLSPDLTVSDAIDRFQAEQQELALVSEGDEVLGLVTITDLLESVMGDIEDPIDSGTL
ncbi:MAG: hemolysin family protein [Salinirussus sp.]